MEVVDFDPGVVSADASPSALSRVPAAFRESSTALVPGALLPQLRLVDHLGLAWKRLFDVVLATVGLVVLAPLFAVIALAILVAEGRPVLFRQTRVGRYGHPFTMVKFRSMVNGAAARVDELQARNERTGPLFKLRRDPRVTAVGRVLRRTSFDELPQLFNVLGGTMSLVGPRPALYSEREQFPPELRVREQLPPGITGLWQVKARSDPHFDRYRELDIEYVRNRSFWLDLGLLLRTPFVVARDTFRHRPTRRARRALELTDAENRQ